MKDDLLKSAEYAALSQEIISLTAVENSYIIAMYTITVTIIGYALTKENEWLYLLPYIILFPFQRVIAAKRDVSLRATAYMAVYLEEGNGYKSKIGEIHKQTTVKCENHNIFGWLKSVVTGRHSALQLGAVSSCCCIIYWLVENWEHICDLGFYNLKNSESVSVYMAIILFILLCFWCKGSFRALKTLEDYIKCLTDYKTSSDK